MDKRYKDMTVYDMMNEGTMNEGTVNEVKSSSKRDLIQALLTVSHIGTVHAPRQQVDAFKLLKAYIENTAK